MSAEISYSETLLKLICTLALDSWLQLLHLLLQVTLLSGLLGLRHLQAWNEMRLCQRENWLLQAPQVPLQSSLGFHFSLWDSAPESHCSGWKSNFQGKFINSKFVPLCLCASIDLYYKGLFFLSSIYLAIKCLQSHPFFSRLCFVGKTNSSFLVFPHLPGFLSLIPPPSPVLHLPIFGTQPHAEFLAHSCSSI